MERVLELFRKFSLNICIKTKYEDFNSYTLSFELTEINEIFTWDDLTFIVSFINERDRLSFNMIVNDIDDPFIFNMSDQIEDNQAMLQGISKIINIDSTVQINYTISKSRINSTLSIYDMDLFYEYLNNLKILHLLNILQRNLNISSINKFELQNNEVDQVVFHSPLLIYATETKLQNIESSYDNSQRDQILKSRLLNTSSQSFSKYKFKPDDFNDLTNNHSNTHRISKLFNKLKIVLAASFISNYSDVKNDKDFQLAIIGHKYIESLANFNLLNNTDAHCFYSIYEWVYEQGDINDKLDLSRNIISRYLSIKENKWILPEDTLSSIQSAHSIYLKENVEKYIETKNKVAEITTELSVKSKDISEYFISSFKNNNLTLLTYFISIFIFNSLSDDSNKKIFTEEKYCLSMIFLLISCIYLLFTSRQLYRDIKINIRYFYSMKRIYKDIFDIRELNNLFNKRHLKYNIKNVQKTVNLWSWIWLIEIILLSLVSIYLTYFIK
jgi:hypothetical protein